MASEYLFHYPGESTKSREEASVIKRIPLDGYIQVTDKLRAEGSRKKKYGVRVQPPVSRIDRVGGGGCQDSASGTV